MSILSLQPRTSQATRAAEAAEAAIWRNLTRGFKPSDGPITLDAAPTAPINKYVFTGDIADVRGVTVYRTKITQPISLFGGRLTIEPGQDGPWIPSRAKWSPWDNSFAGCIPDAPASRSKGDMSNPFAIVQGKEFRGQITVVSSSNPVVWPAASRGTVEIQKLNPDEVRMQGGTMPIRYLIRRL